MLNRFEETSDCVVLYYDKAVVPRSAAIEEIRSGLGEPAARAAASDKPICVDFRGVAMLSSAMMGEFLRLFKTCREKSVAVTARNISRDLNEVLRIARLNRFFRGNDGPDPLGSPNVNPHKPPGDGGRRHVDNDES